MSSAPHGKRRRHTKRRRHRKGRGRRAIVAWIVEYALALGLWFVFAGKLELNELWVGAIAAALAATASHLVRGEHIALFTAEPRWLAQVWRVPKSIVVDTYSILVVLARQLVLRRPAGSRLVAVAFRVGGHEPRSATRRALAVAYTTLTPGMVVLGLDRERGLLVYHELEPSEVPELTRRLGARA